MKNFSLGPIGNTIVGLLGGGVGSQILGGLLGGGMGGAVAGSGVGGALLMIIIGFIKKALVKA